MPLIFVIWRERWRWAYRQSRRTLPAARKRAAPTRNISARSMGLGGWLTLLVAVDA
jgi:hypothetical protein